MGRSRKALGATHISGSFRSPSTISQECYLLRCTTCHLPKYFSPPGTSCMAVSHKISEAVFLNWNSSALQVTD
uniref:Uncharacterized protein n=1 Tax=Arundo donax TaxID=35708 RepID=A0A0A9BC78_ARUDO